MFSMGALFGDPSAEMEVFRDHRKAAPKEAAPKEAAPATLSTLAADGYEVGRIVGKHGANFIVQVGDVRREVPPTDIKRVL